MLLKTGLISCWNNKRNTKGYLPANKHSSSDLNLSSHTNLPCENCYLFGCSVSIRQKDIGILKMQSVRCVQTSGLMKLTEADLGLLQHSRWSTL